MTSEKVIHTGLYGKRAKQMLSDIFELAASEWDGDVTRRQCDVVDVIKAPDGEVIIKEESVPWNAPWNRPFVRPHAQAIKWVCFVVKKLVVEYAYPADDDKYEPGDIKWEKSPIAIRHLSGETVASVMVLHDVLKGVKDFKDKDDLALAQELVGRPNDPVTEGMLIARNDELASLKKALEDKKEQIRKDFQVKREEFYRKMDNLDRESSKLMAAAEDDYRKACEGVKARYAEMIKPVSAAA